jgi:hypothetical protein
MLAALRYNRDNHARGKDGTYMDDLLSHARAVLETTPARWLSLTETLAPALLTRKPAPGAWSALECLQHLLDAEQQVFPARVEHFLAGRDFTAFNPDTEGAPLGVRSPADMAEAFAAARTASLARLARVGESDLSRGARHGELGPVTLGEMLHEWAAHDLMHTVQAERALMQPFIAGSGPWRKYFADHDLHV